MWADPIRGKYSRRATRWPEDMRRKEEGEEVNVLPKNLHKTLMMERNRILRSLVGNCPEKLSYYYDFFVSGCPYLWNELGGLFLYSTLPAIILGNYFLAN